VSCQSKKHTFLFASKREVIKPLPAAKIIHSGETKQGIISDHCYTNKHIVDQGTTTIMNCDLLDPTDLPSGRNATFPVSSVEKDSESCHIQSLFHSVDVSTFQDIFTDDATLEWITTTIADTGDASNEEKLSIGSTTGGSDDYYNSSCDVFDTTSSGDDVDDELGDFLWDVLASV
jgi:hypothetical protein